MNDHWDEFSKSLAASVPRRESLRRLGYLFAGAVLSPLGLGTALAREADPCKTFCNRCPKSQRANCLAACNACNADTSRLCGSCGSYVCCREPGPWEYGACINGNCAYECTEGAVNCDGTCTFLGWDPYNCGACGNVCPASAPYCAQGVCSESPCAPWETLCGDTCVNLNTDFFNCGACGHSCVGSGEYCANGSCENYCNPCGEV